MTRSTTDSDEIARARTSAARSACTRPSTQKKWRTSARRMYGTVRYESSSSASCWPSALAAGLVSYVYDTYPLSLDQRLIQSCIHCLWTERQSYSTYLISMHLE